MSATALLEAQLQFCVFLGMAFAMTILGFEYGTAQPGTMEGLYGLLFKGLGFACWIATGYMWLIYSGATFLLAYLFFGIALVMMIFIVDDVMELVQKGTRMG